MKRNFNREKITEPGLLVMDDIVGKAQFKNHNHYHILTYSKLYHRRIIHPTIIIPHNNKNSKWPKDPILDRPQHRDLEMDTPKRKKYYYGGLEYLSIGGKHMNGNKGAHQYNIRSTRVLRWSEYISTIKRLPHQQHLLFSSSCGRFF